MLEYAFWKLNEIENAISESSSRSDVYGLLRQMGLGDFGELMISLPNRRLPKLSAILPRMASDEIQQNWTGSSGMTLLGQSLDFVRSAAYNYSKITGKGLEGASILDFGCGYGRLARLMYYFTEEENYWGVDPWDRSIQICNDDGLNKNFHVSDYLPEELPLGDKKFDFIFAFSVFTHLSRRATITCLNTISKYIKDDGVMLITIRPIEYWNIDKHAIKANKVDSLKSIHAQDGFAFLPHNRDAVDGDITYGDTSMTLDWIAESFQDLKIVGIDRSLSDPFQIYVFLKKP